jgi:hypothetical protein
VAFRDHKVFGTVGYALIGLSVVSFGAFATLKVFTRHSLQTYYSGTLIQWTYGGAFVAIVVGVLAALGGGVLRFISWYRRR